jgi:HPr kinase/phosphorylase
MTTTIHATAISLNGTAVLIRGSSGAGKSSLALQILEGTGTGLTGEELKAMLISDDQTLVVARAGQIFASPPQTIAGLLEIRGQGILTLPYAHEVPVSLVVDLKPMGDIPRLPEAVDLTTEILGHTIARIAIDPSHPSAAARLRVAWAGAQKPSAQTLAPWHFTA